MFTLVLLTSLLVLLSDAPIGLMEKPRLEWQGCNCNDMTLGLGDEDFMHLQVYIESLEYRASHPCQHSQVIPLK